MFDLGLAVLLIGLIYLFKRTCSGPYWFGSIIWGLILLFVIVVTGLALATDLLLQ